MTKNLEIVLPDIAEPVSMDLLIEFYISTLSKGIDELFYVKPVPEEKDVLSSSEEDLAKEQTKSELNSPIAPAPSKCKASDVIELD